LNKYDFGGWATRYNVACSDGRTILTDAFKHCDEKQVPLVWNHNYSGPESIIGKATLKHTDVGVYAYCEFNQNSTAQTAKNLVIHGDITALSIYANKLKQDGGRVLQGDIKEVSLVLAGANPGASIQEVLVHGEEDSTAAMIYNDEIELEICHADQNEEEVEVKEETKDAPKEEEKVEEAKEEKNPEEPKEEELEHADGEKTVADIYNAMTEEQKKVVAYIADHLLNEDIEEESDMKDNVFEQNHTEELKHGEFLEASLKDAKKYGSLKESFLAHAATYGIEDIESLFPNEHALNNEPQIIDRDQDWVAKFFNGTKKSPFSRLKAVYADVQGDDARALGYVKGNLKKEEVFGLLKRTTQPTTVYKKQKLDRDDILDITDFDVVAFLKKEMRGKLEEELARAMLVGDGRDPITQADDKIKENCIRPVFNDSDLYCIKAEVGAAGPKGKTHEVIKAVIRAMADYEGKGVPTLFCEPSVLADMLLIEDANGRFIYENEAVLARTLRVKEIVPVPVMKGLKRKDKEGKMHNVMAIVVNPADYTVGADKGGQVAMFEDFDIDYNQQKYLIETRCSGALLAPKTAITVEEAAV
jgi:HK97 family phage prohead protease